MAKGDEFSLLVGAEVAEVVIGWLRLAVSRIEVAGSVRRGRARVHDVDLVAIPKTTTDLASTAQPDLDGLRLALKGKCVARTATERIWKLEVPFKEADERSTDDRVIVPVDLYLADETTWATLMLIRTGSSMHNVYLASRAQKMGMKLHADGSGISRDGQRLPCPDEEAIFRHLGLMYRTPQRREVDGRGEPI